MIVTTPKWTKHSDHAGFPIFKRKAGTGTSGGTWMVCSITCKSLVRAREIAESERACHNGYAYTSVPS